MEDAPFVPSRMLRAAEGADGRLASSSPDGR